MNFYFYDCPYYDQYVNNLQQQQKTLKGAELSQKKGLHIFSNQSPDMPT